MNNLDQCNMHNRRLEVENERLKHEKKIYLYLGVTSNVAVFLITLIGVMLFG